MIDGGAVRAVADDLWSVISPGDELRGVPRSDIPTDADVHLRLAVSHLHEAEDALAPRIGQPNPVRGRRYVEHAVRELDNANQCGKLPDDVSKVRADAVRSLERLLGG